MNDLPDTNVKIATVLYQNSINTRKEANEKFINEITKELHRFSTVNPGFTVSHQDDDTRITSLVKAFAKRYDERHDHSIINRMVEMGLRGYFIADGSRYKICWDETIGFRQEVNKYRQDKIQIVAFNYL